MARERPPGEQRRGNAIGAGQGLRRRPRGQRTEDARHSQEEDCCRDDRHAPWRLPERVRRPPRCEWNDDDAHKDIGRYGGAERDVDLRPKDREGPKHRHHHRIEHPVIELARDRRSAKRGRDKKGDPRREEMPERRLVFVSDQPNRPSQPYGEGRGQEAMKPDRSAEPLAQNLARENRIEMVRHRAAQAGRKEQQRRPFLAPHRAVGKVLRRFAVLRCPRDTPEIAASPGWRKMDGITSAGARIHRGWYSGKIIQSAPAGKM